MKSFDITLYGHLSFDNIFEDFKYKTSLGCIANVWNQLIKIDPQLRIKLEPTDFGESLILVDRQQSKRTSVSNLSLNHKIPTIHQSSLSHVMYINELKDTSFISNLNGFVTADICNGTPLNLNNRCLKNIDLLFISDEDVYFDIYELVELIKGDVLLHYTSGSTLYTKKTKIKFECEIVNNVNVLGIGDKFASHIIYELCKSNKNLSNIVKSTHKKLTNLLKNEKI